MDAIAAISTATGKGGIGIIRMSGKDSFKVLEKIFVPKNKGSIKGYTIKYGHIIKAETREVIDEVLVSYFIGPKSYTTEDMCEINTHGGYQVQNEILEECIKNGAVLAQPGEFTQRAFLNGRIDLLQAEAVIDIINSKTENERRAAESQLEGKLSSKIKEIRDLLVDSITDIETSIDYPEYDMEEVTNEKLIKILKTAYEKLDKLKKSYESGKIIRDGLKTVIVGKPNVGKSSLLNLMLNEERAIVSNVKGTTRDTIEEYINLKGIPLKIIDTAGIRETSDEVEQIGVKKSVKILNSSDLIIAVFDDSHELEKEDQMVLDLIKNKQAIILLNKTDLNKKMVDYNKLKENSKHVIKFSVKNEYGINELYSNIVKMFNINEIEIGNGETITSIRHKEYIEKAIENVDKAIETINGQKPIDITAIYIREILENLGNITGENVSEGIIDNIFAKFCLGK